MHQNCKMIQFLPFLLFSSMSYLSAYVMTAPKSIPLAHRQHDFFLSFYRHNQFCEVISTRGLFTFAPSSKSTNFAFSSKPQLLLHLQSNYYDENDYEDDGETAEVITLKDSDDDFLSLAGDDDDQDWISDQDLIRRAAATPGGEALTNRDRDTLEKMKSADGVGYSSDEPGDNNDITSGVSNGFHIIEQNNSNTPNTSTDKNKKENTKEYIYTDEEEELINAMGGKEFLASSTKTLQTPSHTSREPGYLGDSTLREIAMDYSIPICYIADVLVTWGCPIPIDVNSILGDLVTGEQAFALLEAIHTLDQSVLYDRYSDDDIMTVASDYEIELKDAFNFAVKEGWSLPFGVKTHLRVEQEQELIRTLGNDLV